MAKYSQLSFTFLFQILLNFISLGVAEIKNNVALINSAASKIRMIHVTRCVIDTPVDIDAIFAAHFENVPTLRNPDVVTKLEEDRITAYFGAGLLYASPKRTGDVL